MRIYHRYVIVTTEHHHQIITTNQLRWRLTKSRKDNPRHPKIKRKSSYAITVESPVTLRTYVVVSEILLLTELKNLVLRHPPLKSVVLKIIRKNYYDLMEK